MYMYICVLQRKMLSTYMNMYMYEYKIVSS
nr:hypothetical protein JOCKYQNQ_JOCKYQNQ_CDS_0009 [Autographiviridae sp.]